jgi:hypothetical protein
MITLRGLILLTPYYFSIGLYNYEGNFMSFFIDDFLSIISSKVEKFEKGMVAYIERFLEFIIDLLSQLPTR